MLISHPRHLHSFPTRRSSDLVRFREPSSQLVRDRALVLGEAVRVEQADRDGVGVERRERAELERFEHALRSEEHTSELQSPCNLVCRLLLDKKKKGII